MRSRPQSTRDRIVERHGVDDPPPLEWVEDRQWWFLCIDHRARPRVEDALANANIASWCPMYVTAKWRESAGSDPVEVRRRTRAIMPGYLLVSRPDRLPPDEAIRGVLGYRDTRPPPVPAHEMARLHRAILESPRARPPCQPPPVQVGEVVEITAGAFQGSEGEVVAIDGDNVSLILGQMRAKVMRADVAAKKVA